MRVAIFTITIVYATSSWATCEEDVKNLSELISESPEADAEVSLVNGLGMYLAIYGLSVSIPGISEIEASRVINQNMYAVLPGTTDAYCSKEHQLIVQRAKEYAARYNVVIQQSGGAT